MQALLSFPRAFSIKHFKGIHVVMLLLFVLPNAGQSQVLLEDDFNGSADDPPDSTRFTWGGEVSQDGSGFLNFSTWTANTSWLQSITNVTPGAGETLVLTMRLSAYAEPAVYGDLQPRGLRVGNDANNAIEFYSIYGTTLGLRTRTNGVESMISYPFPQNVYAMHDYEIDVTTTSAVFKVDGVIAGTITSNLPTGALDVYVDTYDGGFGNVPVTMDSVQLSLSNSVTATVPSVTTLSASNILATGTAATGTLKGAINPNGSETTAWFEWGRTCAYGNRTPDITVTSNAVVSALINFPAGFPFHYRLAASNTVGCAFGKDQTFWSPWLDLAGPEIFTNAFGVSFVDPGVSAKGAPLAIANGFNGYVVLKADGSVAGWGQYATPPPGISNVVAICAGDSTYTALRADSTITNWGTVYNPPAITSNVVAMADGTSHGLLLLSNGVVAAWGVSNYGDMNVPIGLTNVIALAAGGYHSAALKADGTVVEWGQTNGPAPAEATNVIAIAAAPYHLVALQPGGSVLCWGDGADGKTNVPPDLTNAIAVAAAGHHSLALRSNGQIAGWGKDFYGELTPPAEATNMVEIATGYYNSGGIRADGTVLAWGLNNYSQTVVPTNLMDLSFAVGTQGSVDVFTPGTYTLTYRTTNQIGAVATVTRTVMVSSSPASDFAYTTNNGTITITNYIGPGGNVAIPPAINGLAVTAIGNNAFYNKTTLTTVTIPDGVTTIGDSAFYVCANLTNIVIPDSVTSIGPFAFDACVGLTSVTIPDSVTIIGRAAFDNCAGLTSVIILGGVTNIGDYAFANCTGLNSITIPDSTISLGSYAFVNCPLLANIAIPNSVLTIGSSAFKYCSGLTSVTIGNSVTNIGDQAFYSCPNLGKIYFQGDAPVLGSSVFGGDNYVTVYHLASANGWPTVPDLWGGLPTALWSPTPEVLPGSAGVVSNQFAFTIYWPEGLSTVVVEACTNLANPVWQPVSTNTLSSGTASFGDPQWINGAARFYRLRSP